MNAAGSKPAPEAPGRAYIFDFDGVLVDTMPAHFASYREALAEAGVPLDRDRFYYQAGMTGREQIRWFCRQAGVQADVERIYARKNELAPRHRHLVTPIPENLALLRVLRAAGIAHRYEVFDDDHTNVDYRMDVSLPFLYEALMGDGGS